MTNAPYSDPWRSSSTTNVEADPTMSGPPTLGFSGWFNSAGPSCTLGFGSGEVALPVRQTLGSTPSHVTMTDLGQHAGQVIEAVETGMPALVTKRGQFVAAIVPIDPEQMDSLVLYSRSSGIEVRRDRATEDRMYTLAEAAERLGVDLNAET